MRQQRTGERTPWSSLFRREVNRSILVHILLNKVPSSVAGQSQQLLVGTVILRNPPESGGFLGKYRNSCPTGIPAKTPVKTKKNRNSCDPIQNHVPAKKSSGKRRKKRNPVRNGFLGPKNKFLKTGITNLEIATRQMATGRTEMWP
jgi:hypothetical protein